MLWWICDGEVVGAAGSEEETPANFERVEGVEAGDRDLVYFNGESVALKPEKPSPNAIWDAGDRTWIIPPPPSSPSPAPARDFAALEGRLRNTPTWIRCWNAAKTTVRANAAFTLLLSSLTTNHNFEDLRFAFNEMRSAMDEQSSLNDFSPEELQYVSESLTATGFDLDGFNLEVS